jgi:hypothetical protein
MLFSLGMLSLAMDRWSLAVHAAIKCGRWICERMKAIHVPSTARGVGEMKKPMVVRLYGDAVGSSRTARGGLSEKMRITAPGIGCTGTRWRNESPNAIGLRARCVAAAAISNGLGTRRWVRASVRRLGWRRQGKCCGAEPQHAAG